MLMKGKGDDFIFNGFDKYLIDIIFKKILG
jgi:hypothetical protein